MGLGIGLRIGMIWGGGSRPGEQRYEDGVRDRARNRDDMGRGIETW
jgi:hypothetical protein